MRKNIYICETCFESHLVQHGPEVTAPFMSSCMCGNIARSTFYKLEHIHKNSKADKEYFYENPDDYNSLTSRWLTGEEK